MPFGEIHNIGIRGIMCALPDNIVYTNQYSQFDSEMLARFEEETGVVSTCRVLDQQLASDLCYEAAEIMLQKLGWERNSVGALIYVSTSFDYQTPATSCVLQHRLGLSVDCIAEDINLGCSAYVYGLVTLGSLMQTGEIKRALLLCGENSSKAVDPTSTSGLLYGDAGTATALEWDKDASPISYLLRTDGNKYKNIFARNGGARHPQENGAFVKTSGLDVFAFSIREVPKTILEFMQHFNINKDEVDLFACYQANEKVIGRIIKWCELPPEKVPMTLTKYGNTGAASVPVVINSWLSGKGGSEDTNIVMFGLGVGLSWGAAEITLSADVPTGIFSTRNYYNDDDDLTATAH